MCQRIILAAFIFLFCSFYYFESIYALSVKSLEGGMIHLSDYRNKKILFVVIPALTQDTSFSVEQLVRLQKNYSSSLVVIGIPAIETGFSKADEESIKSVYKDFRSNLILTEPMEVKKSSAKQTELFAWLTHKDKNRHFDYEVKGVGQTFFIDERGELYAVLGPEIKLTNPVIEQILSKQMDIK